MRTLRAFLVALAALAPACGGGGSTPTSPATPLPAPSVPPGPPGTPVIQPGTAIQQTGPADLTISTIERLPKIDYVTNSADPRSDGWPAQGSQVTWRAHLRNWTSRSLDGVDYAWRLDGAAAGSGTVSVRPNSEATVDFPWTWDRARHVLELTVDSSNRFTVRGGPRNHLLVHTDALAVGFYVEQSVYDYFRRFQHELRIGNSSFEDWAHLQLQFYNLIFERATYPDTPQGVLDRLRLDAVHVVPDRSLPLDPLANSIGGAFAPADARPNVGDRTVDLQWGFPISLLEFNVYPDHGSLTTSNQFYYSGFLQHELGHARYLVDVYAWDIYDGTAGSRVDIMEGEQRVAGSRYMPGSPVIYNQVAGIQLYRTRHQGLMSTSQGWLWLDDYSTAALNLIAGHRAVDGNYNEPANIGAFLNDFPRENRVALRDSAGRALGGARVQVFQASPGDQSGQDAYTKYYDSSPDLALRANAEGVVAFPANPFNNDGPVIARDLIDPIANGVAIVRVEHEGRVGYGFLESLDFNMEYWRGHRDAGEYTLTVTLVSP